MSFDKRSSRTLDRLPRLGYTTHEPQRRNYVCRVAMTRIVALLAVLVAAMDAYDRASDADQVRRAQAVAHVLALQYAQQLRHEARTREGLADRCEDCGAAIDAERRRDEPYATVCRECARGDGEV
jgi:RNA polymerase-binding transcription factor DksA